MKSIEIENRSWNEIPPLKTHLKHFQRTQDKDTFRRAIEEPQIDDDFVVSGSNYVWWRKEVVAKA